MRLLTSLGVLVAFALLGDALADVARLPLPGSVTGMLLLAGALRAKLLPETAVEPAATLLLRHMGLMFVPPGVGLMVHAGLLAREWMPIVAASAVSTLAVMLVTGLVHRRMARGDG
jgi:holin-like protein